MNLIRIVLFIFICGGCQSSSTNKLKPINIPDITYIKGSEGFNKSKGYLSYQGKLFSGFVVEYHANDSLKSKSGYWEGKMEGDAKGWYPSGKVWFERFYKRGEKHGEHQGWWNNGQLKFKYQFVDGGFHGKQFGYHRDGESSELRNYEMGKEVGKQTAWSPKGKLVFNYVIKNNKRYGFIGRKNCTSVYEEKNP